MAGSKANYLENAVLNLLGGTSITAPANVYVRLYTAGPDETGAGTQVTGGSYAPAAVVNNPTNWPAAITGTPKSNGTDIVFPAATAAWGTVVGMAIWDAASGGNCFYYGTLTVSKVVALGDTFKFLAGNIIITEE